MFAVDIIMSIVDPFEKKHARLASAFLVFWHYSRRSRPSRSAIQYNVSKIEDTAAKPLEKRGLVSRKLPG